MVRITGWEENLLLWVAPTFEGRTTMAAPELRVHYVEAVDRRPLYLCSRPGCSSNASIEDGPFYFCSIHALEKLHREIEASKRFRPYERSLRVV
jgi:hypothetical protein